MKRQVNLYLKDEIYQDFRKKCYDTDISVSEMIDWYMRTVDYDYQYEEYLKEKLEKINKNK